MGFLKNLFNREAKPGEPIETNDETFNEDISSSEIPAVVDFWSPTCPPCQVLGGLLREVGPEYAGRVNVFKLNVAENPETAARFRIRSVPTIAFIKKGRVVDLTTGVMPLNTLRQKFDSLCG